MKSFSLLLLLLLLGSGSPAQKFLNSQNSRKYTAAAVLNPDYGIVLYEKLNSATGGDSVRLDYRNVPVVGWLEDYYEDGRLLHRGNYVEGKLNVYKNYHSNGQLERSFEVTGLDKFLMKVYYDSGKQRSVMHYKGKAVQKQEDFYPNGQPDFIEEYSKDLEYVIQRRSYFENGKPQDLFELTDTRKKRYSKKEYYESGALKEEGTMVFSREAIDYQKDGLWKSYDESGKITAEENWVLGSISAKEEKVVTEKKTSGKKPAPAVQPSASGELPAEFKSADKNKDGAISADEINACIDAFFDDRGDFTPERINKMIDYFFDQ